LLTPILRDHLQPLELVELDLEPPKADEVSIRMTASGICHSCLHVMDGSLRGAPMPIVLGDEGAGVVEAVGPGVDHVKVGDHVIISWAPSCGRCRYCVIGRPVLCLDQPPFGFLADGTTRMHLDGADVHHYGPATYAPRMVVPASCAIPIRPDMPLDRAALIGCSVMTGVGAVINTAQVSAGASVVVIGCGGIGLNVVQGAAIAAAHPIVAVDTLDARLDDATAMGATAGVRADAPDAVETIMSLTGGGADYVFVAIGAGQALETGWLTLAPGGTLVMLGIMSDGTRIDLSEPNRLMGKEQRLIGSRYGSARPMVDFPRLVDLYLAGHLKIDELITRRFGLPEINEAHDALAKGEVARALLVFD